MYIIYLGVREYQKVENPCSKTIIVTVLPVFQKIILRIRLRWKRPRSSDKDFFVRQPNLRNPKNFPFFVLYNNDSSDSEDLSGKSGRIYVYNIRPRSAEAPVPTGSRIVKLATIHDEEINDG